MKAFAALGAALLCGAALVQTAPAAPTQRLRGTVQSFDGSRLVVAERSRSRSGWPTTSASARSCRSTSARSAAAAPQGCTLKLRYKDGEKSVVVADNVPIVTFKPGDRSLLVPGAKVLVTSQRRDGKPTALRALPGGTASRRRCDKPARRHSAGAEQRCYLVQPSFKPAIRLKTGRPGR